MKEDDCDAFGKHIAQELRCMRNTIGERAVQTAKFKMEQVLFEISSSSEPMPHQYGYGHQTLQQHQPPMYQTDVRHYAMQQQMPMTWPRQPPSATYTPRSQGQGFQYQSQGQNIDPLLPQEQLQLPRGSIDEQSEQHQLQSEATTARYLPTTTDHQSMALEDVHRRSEMQGSNVSGSSSTTKTYTNM